MGENTNTRHYLPTQNRTQSKWGYYILPQTCNKNTQLEENTWKFPWKIQKKKTMVMEGTLVRFCKHYFNSQPSLQKAQMITPRNRAPISYEHYKKIKNQWGWKEKFTSQAQKNIYFLLITLDSFLALPLHTF